MQLVMQLFMLVQYSTRCVPMHAQYRPHRTRGGPTRACGSMGLALSPPPCQAQGGRQSPTRMVHAPSPNLHRTPKKTPPYLPPIHQSNPHRYEHSPFNTGGGGGSADYLFMLVFGAVCLHLANLFMGSYVMGQARHRICVEGGREGGKGVWNGIAAAGIMCGRGGEGGTRQMVKRGVLTLISSFSPPVHRA